MHTEDYLNFTTFHMDSDYNPSPISEPTLIANEPVFPAELLDSGFELTEFLTG
jgi:hypothetical protein